MVRYNIRLPSHAKMFVALNFDDTRFDNTAKQFYGSLVMLS